MLIYHIKVSAKLVQISGKVDIIILYLSGPLILTVLAAKLLGKKVSIYVTGLASKDMKALRSRWARHILPRISRLLEDACFTLADQILVESGSVTQFHNLGRYQNKVAITGGRYVDSGLYSIRNQLAQRGNAVGYIGRVTKSKGVINFAKGIPLIAKGYGSNVRFLIVGDGDQLEQIKQVVDDTGQKDRVSFTGWIPYNELSDYYNQLKLLVLPSYTEGLPGIVQEAMACGTPVLATAVGGVPDLIKDEETGFIMEDNSPECIAKNVMRALEHPRLGEIAQDARNLIEKQYTYDVVAKKCQVALGKLINKS